MAHQAKIRVVTKDPVEKVARQRLSVLQLSQTLGSVSAACRRMGMDRTSFYEWKRRFQTHGLEGLKDLSPVHKTHPMTTPIEVVERVLAISSDNPAWGCVRIADQLQLEGIRLSSPTVQAILIKHGVGTKYERLLRLEERMATELIALTAEQIRLIETAALILHNEVLPFYAERGLPVAAVLTDNGREFCGTDAHPFELYLALNDIEHRKTRVRRPQTNGFVERFHRTVLDEFFRTSLRDTVLDNLDDVQAKLDAWLVHYNHERPHRGYRNMGRRPIETVNQALSAARHDG